MIVGYIMPYRLIFTLLRETGMRVGEVLALNVGDVTLAPGQEGLQVRDPKNRVERVVILGPNSTDWGKLCRRAGLCDETGVPRYTIHQLRHTLATELFEQSHRLETVQRRLGHTDIRTTMGYAEVSDAWVRAELEGGPRR